MSELNNLHDGVKESISKQKLAPAEKSGRNTNTNSNNAFGTQNTIMMSQEMEKTQDMKNMAKN